LRSATKGSGIAPIGFGGTPQLEALRLADANPQPGNGFLVGTHKPSDTQPAIAQVMFFNGKKTGRSFGARQTAVMAPICLVGGGIETEFCGHRRQICLE
jgi:hypothetical protein